MKSTLSRPRFVQSSAFLAAACAASSAVPAFADPSQASGKPSPVQLGLASYTFRELHAHTVDRLYEAAQFDRAESQGCERPPANGPSGRNQGDGRLCRRGRLPPCGGSYLFPEGRRRRYPRQIRICKRAGISVIVAGDPAPATLPRLEKFVREYDIRIAIHNHGPEDKVFPSPLDVLKAVKNMDPRMGCCIDIGHAVRAGTDIVQAIHEVGPRLFNMHFKDLTDFHEKESQVAVGQGKMPFREIFEALIKTNYKGFVDLEYEIHGDDPMPGVTESFAYMRGVLAGMGYRA